VGIVVRVAQEADLPQADRLLRAAFERPLSFQPHLRLHRSFAGELLWVGVDEESVVGTACAVDYGQIAYIGLMAVDPARQRLGIARQLLTHVLDALAARGCKIALLDATDKGAPLYESFGFVDDGRAQLLERASATSVEAAPSALPIEPARDLDEIVDLDAGVFGASREKLLAALWKECRDRCLVARATNGEIVGYLCARDPVLGPWVATNPEAGEALLAAALRLRFRNSPHVMIPRSNDAAVALVGRDGFIERRTLRHMRRGGQTSPGKREMLYGQSSFAHG
jgi:predicted N-acetyltransferase YhbS